MGEGRVRFKSLKDVPLEMIEQFVASLPVDVYTRRIEEVFAENARVRAAKRKPEGKPAKAKTVKKKVAN